MCKNLLKRIPASFFVFFVLFSLLDKNFIAGNNYWLCSKESSEVKNAHILISLVAQKDPHIDIKSLWNQEAANAAKKSKEAFLLI